MVGAICKRDILTHPLVTIRCFGLGVFLRVLCARRDQTFLSILAHSDVLKPPPEGVAEFVGRCVELELTASRIYGALSRRFMSRPPVHDFFAALAVQEESHAELLEICRTAASQQRWDADQTVPWSDVVPRLEQHMADAEVSLNRVDDVRQSLERVIAIESSEINDVFRSVVAASDSVFVRRLKVFHQAECQHLDYICRQIALLEPALVPASEVLRQRCA
jgi:hypothetical protein